MKKEYIVEFFEKLYIKVLSDETDWGRQVLLITAVLKGFFAVHTRRTGHADEASTTSCG
jgi:hypothetical protein